MKENFKQFIFAREYRGLTQSDLASKIEGLSQSNLSKFEKGIGVISDVVKQRIIAYLGFPVEFYDENISNAIENAHYRKKASVTKRQCSIIEFSNKLIGNIIDDMALSVVFPTLNIRKFDLDLGEFTPDSAARAMRKFWKLSEGPVRDIISLFENNGIIVDEIEEDVDAFDGVSFVTDNGYYVTVINKNFCNDHKRFTLAHELGHIVMHIADNMIVSNNRNKENEANQFASEFLMPSDEITDSLRSLRKSDLYSLKLYWLTSMASIVRRAKDLGCINLDKYRYLNVELSRQGYKKNEPGNVYIDNPHLFAAAYLMHRQNLNYTDKEIAAAFKLPLDVISKFCHQMPFNLVWSGAGLN